MRFYGGTPAYWRRESYAVARRCLEEIPKLRARECLAAAMVVAVGTCSMKPADQAATLRSWRSAAGVRDEVRRLDKKQLRDKLKAAGIAVVTVRKGNA